MQQYAFFELFSFVGKPSLPWHANRFFSCCRFVLNTLFNQVVHLFAKGLTFAKRLDICYLNRNVGTPNINAVCAPVTCKAGGQRFNE